MVSSLHRFLRDQWQEFVGHRARRFAKCRSLEQAIDTWQAPYINDESKPDWYRGMLFNELYVLADGGSFWGRPVGADSKTPTTYSFMECFDYPFYETLDVRFYGSMPLAKFWPDIDKQVMRDFADTVPKHLDDRMAWIWKSQESRQPPFRDAKQKAPCRTTWACRTKIRFSKSINSVGRTPTAGRI